ncbi:MAG: tRNA (adenosine(37)-N6)-threonylcarbamoyltransferase complex ATPase subunit type 1 TsaE [Polyangiaceae bacterium]
MSAATLVWDLPTRRSTIRLAQLLAPLLEPSDFIVLSGDLGTGKTFFVRALCRRLGVPAEIEVTSPTFTLVQELSSRLPIVHADAYRLRDEGELLALGLRDARAEGALLVLEWGAPYVAVLGGDALSLSLEHGSGPSARKATIEGTGERGRALVTALAPLLKKPRSGA